MASSAGGYGKFLSVGFSCSTPGGSYTVYDVSITGDAPVDGGGGVRIWRRGRGWLDNKGSFEVYRWIISRRCQGREGKADYRFSRDFPILEVH